MAIGICILRHSITRTVLHPSLSFQIIRATNSRAWSDSDSNRDSLDPSLSPTHKRQRPRPLTPYSIPLTVGRVGRRSSAIPFVGGRLGVGAVVGGCFPIDRFLSLSLFAIFIRYFCFGKNKTVGTVAAPAQMQLFLLLCRRSVCSIIGGGQAGQG